MDAKVKPVVRVAAAAIVKEGRVLATCRGTGRFKGFWELPGGKVEYEESPAECAVRELREELKVEIVLKGAGPSFKVEYEYPDFILQMEVFLARLKEDSPEPTLTEHQDMRYLGPGELESVTWLEADYRFLPQLKELLTRHGA